MTELKPAGPIHFFDSFVDQYIAPELSRFKEAEIPDLTKEFDHAPHWIANSLLNRAFRWRLPGDMGRFMLAYVRRVQHAFSAYHAARQTTADYLTSRMDVQPSWRTYYRALEQWENFTLQCVIAIDLMRKLAEADLFDKKDLNMPAIGRLYGIGNKVKHLESRDGNDEENVNNTVPLWLSNDGLQSYGLSLTYIEAADELRRLSGWANKMQDPMAHLQFPANDNEVAKTPAES